MNLAETFITLQDALEPLGIRIGPEVLAGWQFHAGNGHQPLPPDALRHLAEVLAELLADDAEAARRMTEDAARPSLSA